MPKDPSEQIQGIMHGRTRDDGEDYKWYSWSKAICQYLDEQEERIAALEERVKKLEEPPLPDGYCSSGAR